MGRSPCCEKIGLKKGPWTPEEDQKLLAYIDQHGHGSWRALPGNAGLQRCGKSCRLRWANYLRPDIKRGKFSLQEEQTIIQLHALLGNRWSAIATHLPKRTDNEIKNYWNTHLKKRLDKMGIDPVTHKPKNEAHLSDVGPSKSLSHMAQWESARLEAEARLARQSKLRGPIACTTLTPATLAPVPPELVSGGTNLESPMSTISFSDNMASGSGEKSSDLHIINNYLWFPDSIGENKNESASEENFMTRFTDLLLNNFGSDTGDDQSSMGRDDEIDKDVECDRYKDNKNYWNNILNLVNSSPSDSPVF